MKIGIQTWGSEGDVRPLMALAAGLRSVGHDVTLVVTHVANKDYSALGAAFGVPLRQAGRLDPDRAKHAGEVLVRETNALKQVELILRDLFEPVEQDMLREAKLLCRENDLVIGHFLVHPLKIAAELANKPCISVFLAPLIPSAEFPPPGIPHLGTTMNSVFWKLGGFLMDRTYLPRVNGMRRTHGIPLFTNAMRDAFLSPRLNLVASSPTLVPTPQDWDSTIHQCGAFHLPGRTLPDLAQRLEQFLAAGPPPVYMTFGSMSLADPSFTETLRLFTDAAKLADCRTVIQTEDLPGDRPADILFVQQVEHDLVFPRCAAVVHHGGAGTTHAASRAGCPSVVVEHVTDQAFWGGVLHRAGIAPPMLHRRTVTAAQLARAVKAALGSPSMRENARAVGESMRKEDGVNRAVALIGKSFGNDLRGSD